MNASLPLSSNMMDLATQYAANPAALFARHAINYQLDHWERSILLLDTLRQRGDNYLQHYHAGKPPVLAFPYEIVMDGRELENPVNYQLLRILPDPAVPMPSSRRPVVVVDPRAGHGPGIGGSKLDSEIGEARSHGHPVYFISFLPTPVPGQTITDVAMAEAAFLKKVATLHPKAEGRALVMGNCQAGWAVMGLAAARPELVGLLVLNGAPLSYWAGSETMNPMRYSGGLLGGSWLTRLICDLGAGTFDGAWLVQNFESLNPANTWFGKLYNLYAKVDTEAPRFLDFEKWWGGHFLMTDKEILSIVDELFIGNKLSKGELRAPDGNVLDLRAIRCPIVVFCSLGDNITPPPQALNWVLDLYENDEALVAHGQTIVYLVHQHIGHLGIFVSGQVARKEHAELVTTMDQIDLLAPGLYEMVIEDRVDAEASGDPYRAIIERRTLDDLRSLDDGRDDELAFQKVALVSDTNNTWYDNLVHPWLSRLATPASAELQRQLHPQRLKYTLWSSMNPLTFVWSLMAAQVHAHRHPVVDDNPFSAMEKQWAKWVELGWNTWRDVRDESAVARFKAIYESPLIDTFYPTAAIDKPDHARLVADRRRERALLHHAAIARARDDASRGGFPAALARALVYVFKQDDFDLDAARALGAERLEHPALASLSHHEMRTLLREQFYLLKVDEAHALASLREVLPQQADRSELLNLTHYILQKMGGASETEQSHLATLAQALDTPLPEALPVGMPAATGLMVTEALPAASPIPVVAKNPAAPKARATSKTAKRAATKAAVSPAVGATAPEPVAASRVREKKPEAVAAANTAKSVAGAKATSRTTKRSPVSGTNAASTKTEAPKPAPTARKRPAKPA